MSDDRNSARSVPIDDDTDLAVVLQKKDHGDHVELHVDAYGDNDTRDEVITLMGVALEETTGDRLLRIPHMSCGIVIKLSRDGAIPQLDAVEVLSFGEKLSDDQLLKILTAILKKHKENMKEGK